MRIIDTIYAAYFSELDDDQKKQAIEIVRELNALDSDPFWARDLIEETREDLKAYGIEDAEILYSGFSSQGDGASISTGDINIEMFLRKIKKWSDYSALHTFIKNNEINMYVVRNDRRYMHSNTVKGDCSFTWQVRYSTKQMNLCDALQQELTDTIRVLSDDLYKRLDSENDYHDSDKAIIENIECNEYEFQVNSVGKVIKLA